MDKTFVPVIVLMVLGVSLTTLLKWVGPPPGALEPRQPLSSRAPARPPVSTLS